MQIFLFQLQRDDAKSLNLNKSEQIVAALHVTG